MFVAEYMTSDPVVVSTHEPVDRLAMTMRRLGIHQAPVVDEAGRLVGIVSDRDVRSAIGYGDRNRELSLKAEDVMTTDVVTVSPGTELIQAVDILRRRRFGALPVVEGDKVVGIISKHDLLRRLYEILREASPQAERRPLEAGRTNRAN